eukprot:4695394-Pyramimonas_sp.AAC.1
MAVDIKVGPAWQAFIAERRPQQLDDATKERHCEFFDAAKKMSPEEPFDVPPTVLPDDARDRRLRPRRKAPSGPLGEVREEGLHCVELVRSSAKNCEGRGRGPPRGDEGCRRGDEERGQ